MTDRPLPISVDSADPLDSLTLTGLEIFAHHGVFDFERENGQTFIVDVTVWLDTRPAAAGDELAATLHYGELAEEIHRVSAADPVDLIETLAERIAATVLAHAVARRVRVTVHKPDAPIRVPFADVSITITRSARDSVVSADREIAQNRADSTASPHTVGGPEPVAATTASADSAATARPTTATQDATSAAADAAEIEDPR